LATLSSPILYLWFLSQKENNNYDTYDSLVIAAYTENEAKRIHPKERWWGDKIKYDIENDYWTYERKIYTFNSDTWNNKETIIYVKYEEGWAFSAEKVIAQCIGVALDNCRNRQIICASFNAG